MIISKQNLIGKLISKQVIQGKLNKATEYIVPTTQEKTITPTKQSQEVLPDENIDLLSKVIVNAIPNEYIIPQGQKKIIENGITDVAQYASANINVQPVLQNKTITITENGETDIFTDFGYDGLNQVNITTNVSNSSIVTLKQFEDKINDFYNNLLNKVPSNRNTYTNQAVTLYSPNADYQKYIILKRNTGYRVLWTPFISIFTHDSSNNERLEIFNVFNKKLYKDHNTIFDNTNTVIVSGLHLYTANGFYTSQQFNTVEEIIQKMQIQNEISYSFWSSNPFAGITGTQYVTVQYSNAFIFDTNQEAITTNIISYDETILIQ